MAERNLNFDSIINRRGTKCLKYDFAKQRGLPEDVLPLWVADMDFKTSSYVEDALIEQAKHAIYGYTEVDDEYFESVYQWVNGHFGWDVKRSWFHKTPGVVFAIANAVRAVTKEGDAILIQQPVYYPFSGVINDNERKLVSSDLVNDGTGFYTIDFEDFENKIIENNVKLFLLCNPHNPVGRVWTKEELIKIGDICVKHGVIVFSDEIHADFVWNGKHEVFANLDPAYAQISITATSPSKTFNIAGLQVSNIFIPNREIYKKFRKAYDASGYSQLNAAGIIAAQAAYNYGEEWYEAVSKYIKANIDFAEEYIKDNLPKVVFKRPEGTYLIWLDFGNYGLSDKEIDNTIIYKAGLWLDGGSIFGDVGMGFQRINVACPREVLTEALDRIKNAFSELS